MHRPPTGGLAISGVGMVSVSLRAPGDSKTGFLPHLPSLRSLPTLPQATRLSVDTDRSDVP